jgi:ABC-2 type transport system ATP-binding protein
LTIIQAHDLTKVFRTVKKKPGVAGAISALIRPRYERKTAVDGVSFSIDAGELVGYIGVNGAGKSTTIKMLTGILMPSGGHVRVLGRDPYRQRIANAHDIGVVFGQRTQLWWDLALIESLNFVARIYEVPPVQYRRSLSRFVETLDLKELLDVPIRNLSLGQRMRAELAATLIHEPRVVYLDEPTIGLDLIIKERIREFIKEQNGTHGTTVILTTHDLSDIEEICQRVMIIDAGRLIYDGPLTKIKDRFGKYREITFDTTGSPREINLPQGSDLLHQDDHQLRVRFDRTVITASQVTVALMDQIQVTDFSLSEPDLSSIVRQIYRGALGVGVAA